MIDNYKPYRRRIWVMFALLFLLNGVAIFTGFQAKDPAYPSVTATQGPQGKTGEQGATGSQGLPGLSIQGEPGPVGPQGAEGPQGEPGTNGREVEFRCNHDNNNYEYRYVGDDNWHIIEQNSNACKSSTL